MWRALGARQGKPPTMSAERGKRASVWLKTAAALLLSLLTPKLFPLLAVSFVLALFLRAAMAGLG